MRTMFGKVFGFTLVEMMVVVAIIGLIAAIAMPNYFIHIKNTKISQTKANLHTMRTALDSQSLIYERYLLWSEVSDDQADIIAGGIPNNPFSTQTKWSQTTPRNIVYNMAGAEKGTLFAGGGLGWCYDEQTGEFWANTRTEGVNENEF